MATTAETRGEQRHSGCGVCVVYATRRKADASRGVRAIELTLRSAEKEGKSTEEDNDWVGFSLSAHSSASFLCGLTLLVLQPACIYFVWQW